jgi:hypothetical protein
VSDGEDNRSLAGFWNRARRLLPGGGHPPQGGWEPADAGAIHRSKTLKPFMQAVADSPSPVVVDLGPVVGSNVTFLGTHLSCKIYPEDLYADFDQPFRRGEGDNLTPVLAAKLRQAPGSVDGILAWDVFDYLGRVEAAELAARLAAILRPGGVMMALFTAEPRDEAASRRYVIVDPDHLRHRRAPGARWSRRVWPLRDIQVLLAPLEVVQSHLLAHHQREMLLRRPAGSGKAG